MRNKKEIFNRLIEVYKKAKESGRTGLEEDVNFYVPKGYFYFKDSSKEILKLDELADFLEGRGYEGAVKIKDWAQDKF